MGAVLQSLISLWKRKGKKNKSYYNTEYSYLVTHPSTNPGEQGLTLLSGRNMLLSLWFNDFTLNAFYEKGYKKEKKNLWSFMAGKVVRDKKLEDYENENYYLLWWSDKRHFPYNCLGLSDEDNAVSRTDNFVYVYAFNSVASRRVLSYRCVLHYFSTMPGGFNFNLTVGLKPQVGGIKIVTVYKLNDPFSKLSGS